jgi:hypothetical protein
MPSIALINLPLTQAAASCSGLHRAARELPPRVLIVDSQAAKFFEANFVTGTELLQPWYGVDITGWHSLQSCSIQCTLAGKMHEVGKAHRGHYSKSQWPTGAAISPYDGDIFVSSYQVLAASEVSAIFLCVIHHCRTCLTHDSEQCRMQACCVFALPA